jgi:tight adherence protein C
MIAIALLAILLLGTSAALVVRALTLPRLRAVRALDQIQAYGFASVDAPEVEEQRAGPVELIGASVATRLNRDRLSKLRRDLLAAGLHRTTVERYLGLYAISIIAVPLLMVWFAATTHAPPGIAVFEIGMGLFVGGLAPQALLSRRARFRLERIDYEIPELVDLLVVGIEGGMGFNGAIRAASHRVDGPLGDEMLLMQQQQSLGASTTEALENLLGRCDTPAVRSFVRTIVQGERLGVSIGQLMRTLAEEMRKRRKSRAEERAQRTPIKILFPLVFVILPAMLIVVMTPAIANITHALSNP